MPRYWPFNKYPGTDYETFNWDWILKTVKTWSDYLENFFKDNGGLHEIVTKILTEHPEWTTTVMDGAVTRPKIADKVLYYITPEMFGAVGDGVTDDSSAINDAITESINTGIPVKGVSEKYAVTYTVNIDGLKNSEIDFSISEIIFNGVGYAFRVTNSENSTIRIKRITSASGSGMLLVSDSVNNYIQYLDLYIDTINITYQAGECIKAHAIGAGWVNEITLWNCRLFSSAGGVYLLDETTAYEDGINGWKFYEVGCEGYKTAADHLKYGLKIESIGGKDTRNIQWIGGRYNESLDKFIIASGRVFQVTVINPYPISTSMIDISGYCTAWTLMFAQYTVQLLNNRWVYNTMENTGQQLSDNTDLNTIGCGVYNTRNSATTATIIHKPEGASFGRVTNMSLSDTGDQSHAYANVIQKYEDVAGRSWIRAITTNGNANITATPWKETTNSATYAGTEIAANTNINTLHVGAYNTVNAARVATLTNLPTGAGFGLLTVDAMLKNSDVDVKWSYIRQTYTDYNNKTWTRILTTDGATPPNVSAGSWKEL